LFSTMTGREPLDWSLSARSLATRSEMAPAGTVTTIRKGGSRSDWFCATAGAIANASASNAVVT